MSQCPCSAVQWGIHRDHGMRDDDAGGPRPPRHDLRGPVAGWTLAAAAAAIFAALAGLIPRVSGGQALVAEIVWAETLGVSLAFRIDGLSLLFGLLISGFGALVTLYALRYLRGHRHLARFVLYL